MVRESPMRSGLKPWMVSFRLEAPRGPCSSEAIIKHSFYYSSSKNGHIKLQDCLRQQGDGEKGVGRRGCHRPDCGPSVLKGRKAAPRQIQAQLHTSRRLR